MLTVNLPQQAQDGFADAVVDCDKVFKNIIAKDSLACSGGFMFEPVRVSLRNSSSF